MLCTVSLCLVEAINLMIKKANSANEFSRNLAFTDLRPWNTCSCSLSEYERLIKHDVIAFSHCIAQMMEWPCSALRSLGSFMPQGFLNDPNEDFRMKVLQDPETLQSLGTEHSSEDANGEFWGWRRVQLELGPDWGLLGKKESVYFYPTLHPH